MAIEELLLLSLAVSLDAFGIAIAIGLNDKATKRMKILFAISFGFFQFLFCFLGGFGGKIFTENIASIPTIIGGMVVAVVGVLMIKEGMNNDEDNLIFNSNVYFVLGISVSIDAMVIGFITFSKIGSIITLSIFTSIVGVVTFIMSILAFVIARYLGKIYLVGKYADYIGGVILILFGLKMIFF
ncbi:MAG: manganese efflux pump [Clostridium sp.]|uniref:manganese efflux pump n=1 Tax=Clostridium sp. TaxID=1506 RepID=UPI00303F1699